MQQTARHETLDMETDHWKIDMLIRKTASMALDLEPEVRCYAGVLEMDADAIPFERDGELVMRACSRNLYDHRRVQCAGSAVSSKDCFQKYDPYAYKRFVAARSSWQR